MKKLICCFLMLVCATTVFSQVKAEDLLEKASQVYTGSNGLEVAFAAHIRSEKNNVSESFEGVIKMRGNRFYLQTPDMVAWYDGSSQWLYIPSTKEVNISTPSGNDLNMLNPMVILQNYKKEYKVQYVGESTSTNAKPAYDVRLIPFDNVEIEHIDVQLEKKAALPSRIVVNMKKDAKVTVHVQEIKTDVDWPEVTFVFPEQEFYDNRIEIIDLR